MDMLLIRQYRPEDKLVVIDLHKQPAAQMFYEKNGYKITREEAKPELGLQFIYYEKNL